MTGGDVEREHLPSPQDRSYNGWANYPTWAVYTWLSNDENCYYRARAIAYGSAGPDRAANELRDDTREASPLAEESGLYVDLLGWAIQIVDWEAVARAFGPEEWEDKNASDSGEAI